MKKLALLVLCSALLLGCGGKEKMEAMTSLPETTASAEAREKVVPVDTPAQIKYSVNGRFSIVFLKKLSHCHGMSFGHSRNSR